MKGVRLIAAALCALLVLAVPVMADDGWELPGVVDQNDTPALEQPAEPSPESPPAPEPAPPAEPPRGTHRGQHRQRYGGRRREWRREYWGALSRAG